MVWIPDISRYERDCYLGRPLEFQTTKPNHQFIISWKLKVQDISDSIILKFDFLGYIGLANFGIRKIWANILSSDFLEKIRTHLVSQCIFFVFFFPWFSLRSIACFVFLFSHIYSRSIEHGFNLYATTDVATLAIEMGSKIVSWWGSVLFNTWHIICLIFDETCFFSSGRSEPFSQESLKIYVSIKFLICHISIGNCMIFLGCK